MIIGVLFLGFEKQTGQGHLFSKQTTSNNFLQEFFCFSLLKDVKGNGFRVHRWDTCFLFFSFLPGPVVFLRSRRPFPFRSAGRDPQRVPPRQGAEGEAVWAEVWSRCGGLKWEGNYKGLPSRNPRRLGSLVFSLFFNTPTPRNPRRLGFPVVP